MAEQAVAARSAADESYERDDIRIRGILVVGAASLVVLVLVGITLWGLVSWFAASHRQPQTTAIEQAPLVPPPPHLQPSPKDDLAAMRAQEQAILQRWAWVDREAGVAQIPIDRAMALLAERGWPLPDRPDNPVPPRATAAQPELPDKARSGSAAEPDKAPRMSPQETGPAQAVRKGGTR